MKTFWFFRLWFRRAYDSAYDSDFRFSLGHKLSYDSDYDSDSIAGENQPLRVEKIDMGHKQLNWNFLAKLFKPLNYDLAPLNTTSHSFSLHWNLTVASLKPQKNWSINWKSHALNMIDGSSTHASLQFFFDMDWL